MNLGGGSQAYVRQHSGMASVQAPQPGVGSIWDSISGTVDDGQEDEGDTEGFHINDESPPFQHAEFLTKPLRSFSNLTVRM